MQKILIVEDDIDIQDILKNHLIDLLLPATLPQDHSPYISSSWVRYTQTLHLPCLWCACGLSDVERWQEEKSGSMQGLPNAFFSNQR